MHGEAAARAAELRRARDQWLRALARGRGRGALDAVSAPIDEESLAALFEGAGPALRRHIECWALEDRGRRSPLGGSDLVELGFSGPAIGRPRDSERVYRVSQGTAGGAAGRSEAEKESDFGPFDGSQAAMMGRFRAHGRIRPRRLCRFVD